MQTGPFGILPVSQILDRRFWLTLSADLKELQGKYVAMVLDNGVLSVGIRWYIYGYSATSVWFRSVDGGRESKLGVAEFDALIAGGTLVIRSTDPYTDHQITVRRFTAGPTVVIPVPRPPLPERGRATGANH